MFFFFFSPYHEWLYAHLFPLDCQIRVKCCQIPRETVITAIRKSKTRSSLFVVICVAFYSTSGGW